MQRKIFYLLLLFVICPVILTAGTKGRIKGKVVDLQTGEGLIGANVVVVGSTFGANSDANGDFLIQNLEAGVYELQASYVGYKTIKISNVRVSSDLTSYQNIQLPSQDIQVGTVDIVAQRPLIQKDNTNAVRITTSEDISALPIRNVTNIIGLTSGVVIQNGLIFIRGGRSDEVGYYLEGASSKDPLSNRSAVAVTSDALEEIQVQSGGYTAEFGGANAGIVRQQLKSGGSKMKASFEWITDNIGFKSKANAFDGEKTLDTYSYGYNEMSGVISGPINDRIKFFVNGAYQYNRDPNPQPSYNGVNLGLVGNPVSTQAVDTLYNFQFPAGARPGLAQERYTLTGTLNFDLSKSILLRATGTWANVKTQVSGPTGFSITDFMNTRRGQTDNNTGNFTLKMTHVINPNMFYELSAGYMTQAQETYDLALKDNYWAYGDSTANAAAGWTIPRSKAAYANNTRSAFGNTTPAVGLNIFGFTFTQNGAVPVSYSKFNRASLTLNGSLSMLIGKTHALKIGGEFQQYTVRNWSGIVSRNLAQTLVNRLADNTAKLSVDEIKADILRGSGVSNFGYDVLGNTYDGSGIDAPHKPVFASAYIQDKIEYEDLIINVGLRYDYIDIDNYHLADMSWPDAAYTKANTLINMDGLAKNATYSSVSPRLGFSFPVTTTSMFHAQYGKFVQQPQLSDVYQGYYSFAQRIKGAGNYYPTVTGPDLRPTRTTQYELGFTQQLTDNISFDITGFYRDVRDQVEYVKQLVQSNSNFPDPYYILGNGDFATTKGFEINVTMRRNNRLQVNANLSFQDAQGTGSSSNQNSGIVFQPLDPSTIYAPKVVTPLTMNRPLSGNIAVDYRWADNDGGKILQNLGISALITFNSGHPYTRGTGNESAESDARNRSPIEALNSSSTPGEFQVDLRIDKTFKIWDRLGLNVYVSVINLFDAINVRNVFLKTGTADDNAFLSNPDYSDARRATYGPQYDDVYKALNLDYQNGYSGTGTGIGGTELLYGPPRQIRLGVRLEY
jgi:outer membrane receptor protein involved in Fe transport